MTQSTQIGSVWVVHAAPDGIPRTYDGEWAAVISVHTTKESAETHAQYERDSGVWGDFSHTEESHPDYNEDKTSSDRAFWIEVDCVNLFDDGEGPRIAGIVQEKRD